MSSPSRASALFERSFRASTAQIEQPWDRLTSWLRANGHEVDDLRPQQFSGGVANLNYRVHVDGREVVLRRPPAGQLAEGASDMAREWRVLSALPSSYSLAPRGLGYCDDLEVLGAPFLLVEYRPGIGIGASLPAEWGATGPATLDLVGHLAEAMASLHRLDPAEVGLAGLGRPEAFLARQVEGWARRADAAYDEPSRDAAMVVEWLREHCPDEAGGGSLLHCDFKPDNMLVDPVSRQPVAVVDWDMATTGDPLFDLGVLLAYWVEPGDPSDLHALRQVPSLEPGAPTRAQVAQAYLDAAGRQAEDLSFYFTLGRLRLAIAWRQLYVLHRRGALPDPKYAGFAGLADAVLGWTADSLDHSPI